MKNILLKKITTIFVCTLMVTSVFASDKNSAKGSIENTFHIEIKTSQSIPDENVTALFYILSHTYENNIHKMRGETGNQVYYNEKSGQEIVYDKNGKTVNNPYNKGTYNYAKYTEPFKKFSLDIFPWLKNGNGRNDPTSFGERLYAYLWDLDCGIQSYLFTQDKLQKIRYRDLSESEKQVVHLFNQIIFNEDYQIQMNANSLPKLRNDSNYYFTYLDQIFSFMGFEK